MPSYHHGHPTGLTTTRIAGTLTLGPRAAVAALTDRHPNTVRNHCAPVACDVATRAALYDLDTAAHTLQTRRQKAAA